MAWVALKLSSGPCLICTRTDSVIHRLLVALRYFAGHRPLCQQTPLPPSTTSAAVRRYSMIGFSWYSNRRGVAHILETCWQIPDLLKLAIVLITYCNHKPCNARGTHLNTYREPEGGDNKWLTLIWARHPQRMVFFRSTRHKGENPHKILDKGG